MIWSIAVIAKHQLIVTRATGTAANVTIVGVVELSPLPRCIYYQRGYRLDILGDGWNCCGACTFRPYFVLKPLPVSSSRSSFWISKFRISAIPDHQASALEGIYSERVLYFYFQVVGLFALQLPLVLIIAVTKIALGKFLQKERTCSNHSRPCGRRHLLWLRWERCYWRMWLEVCVRLRFV